MNLVDTIQENVAVAVTTLRTSKLRSALTILGVVIGISTVMAMATIVCAMPLVLPLVYYMMKHLSRE